MSPSSKVSSKSKRVPAAGKAIGTQPPASSGTAVLSKDRTDPRRPRLTHTNTDKECLRDNAGFLRRAVYMIDTHNGFKFFTLVERTICHVVAWLCFATVATYSFIFLQGFVDGFQTTEVVSTDAAFAATVVASSSSAEDITGAAHS